MSRKHYLLRNEDAAQEIDTPAGPIYPKTVYTSSEWLSEMMNQRGLRKVDLLKRLKGLGWEPAPHFITSICNKDPVPPERFGILFQALQMTPVEIDRACSMLAKALLPPEISAYVTRLEDRLINSKTDSLRRALKTVASPTTA